MNESEKTVEWERWREQIANSADALRDDVEAACPGPHVPRVHRDGRGPWCNVCRRTSDGVLIE